MRTVTQTVNTFRPFQDTASFQNTGFRVFRIEDPTGVEVPGCLSIEQLLLDNRLIPAYIEEEVLKDRSPNMRNRRDVEVPLYDLVQGPRCPVVIRSTKSNDGLWQEGSILSIKGQWADEGDGLDEMTMKDLMERAQEKGLVFPKVGVKKIDVIEAIRTGKVPVAA